MIIITETDGKTVGRASSGSPPSGLASGIASPKRFALSCLFLSYSEITGAYWIVVKVGAAVGVASIN